MGFEPTTSSLASWHSTTELPPPGARTKNRTWNLDIKSVLLCQLSYAGAVYKLLSPVSEISPKHSVFRGLNAKADELCGPTNYILAQKLLSLPIPHLAKSPEAFCLFRIDCEGGSYAGVINGQIRKILYQITSIKSRLVLLRHSTI